jgi:hypothetical protein
VTSRTTHITAEGDEYETILVQQLGRGTPPKEKKLKKTSSMPLRSPQISHEVTRNLTQ